MEKRTGRRSRARHGAAAKYDDTDKVCISARRGASVEYDDIDDTLSSQSKPKPLEYLLNQLFDKRGSTREHALCSIVEAFTNDLQHQFAGKNFATLHHRCLTSIKKGSAKEIDLSSHAIGLLAMTVESAKFALEIYEESLPALCQALKSGSKSLKILDCLAIVTFVGAHNSEETERSMQIIWQFIHPESGSNVSASKHSKAVLATAISAWSFLLTTMEGWRLNYKYWKGAISYFLNLLEEDNESICIIAGEALALIFEIGVEKFSSEAKGYTDSSIHEGNASPNEYSCIQVLKDQILKQMRSLSSGENSANLVLKFFEDDYCLKTFTKIGERTLALSTWSQLMQLNFLKRFLGRGFVKHMLENELLHDIFEFTPKGKQLSGNELYVSNNEEVIVHFFQPEVRNRDCFKRIYMSPNSVLSKARTKLLNKQRILSQGGNINRYVGDDGSEAA